MAKVCWTGWRRRKLRSGGSAGCDEARAKPGELDKVAAQARELREWFRGFVRKHMGRPLTPKALSELEPLNPLLAAR